MGYYQSKSSRVSYNQVMNSNVANERLYLTDNISIKIEKIKVVIEKKSIKIDERSPIVLRFKTPHFRATAIVRFPPLCANEKWKVGWIQACTHMQFDIKYGRWGTSSWEFPELESGKLSMISDSDGKNFPFYGSHTESVIIEGPQPYSSEYHVSMNDDFKPLITWDLPVLQHNTNVNTAKLTHVKRHQKFLTWLVAMNMNTGDLIVLRTYKWRINIEIDVDPKRKLGERAVLVSEECWKNQPKLCPDNIRIPSCALYPASANSSQVLVWRANDGSYPIVVIGPLIA